MCYHWSYRFFRALKNREPRTSVDLSASGQVPLVALQHMVTKTHGCWVGRVLEPEGAIALRLSVNRSHKTRKIGLFERRAMQFSNLGSIYKLRGDPEETRTLWTRARDLFEKIGMPHMVAKLQNWLDELP